MTDDELKQLISDGYEQTSGCDWCCGSGRVTKRVLQAMGEFAHPVVNTHKFRGFDSTFNAPCWTAPSWWPAPPKSNAPITHSLGAHCDLDSCVWCIGARNAAKELTP